MKNTIKWIAGILLLVTALGAFFKSSASGVIYFIVGLFLIPPILDSVERNISLKIPTVGKWIIVIGGIFLGGILLPRTSSESSYNSNTNHRQGEASDKDQLVIDIGVGQILRTEYFDVSVNKVKTSTSVRTGNSFADKGPEPGVTYLILNVTYKNIDNESRMINEGSVFINYRGKEYEYDESETIMIEGWGIMLDQINPLTSKTTNIVYKIPTEITGAAYYEPGRNYDAKRIYLGDLKLD